MFQNLILAEISKNFNSDIQKKLIDVFGKIQLDINLTDSYSGLSE